MRRVGLHAEFGQEKRRPQHDDERVDDDPLLMQLEDVAQQGVFQRLQLAEWALMGCLLLGLEDLVQGIDVANPLRSPLHKIGVADTQFRHGVSQRHTLRHQLFRGGNEAMLPAHGIAHADFPTAATGLDDTRHRGWVLEVSCDMEGRRDVRCDTIFPPRHISPSHNFNPCVNLVQSGVFWYLTQKHHLERFSLSHPGTLAGS